jgi:hypothetical protein
MHLDGTIEIACEDKREREQGMWFVCLGYLGIDQPPNIAFWFARIIGMEVWNA